MTQYKRCYWVADTEECVLARSEAKLEDIAQTLRDELEQANRENDRLNKENDELHSHLAAITHRYLASLPFSTSKDYIRLPDEYLMGIDIDKFSCSKDTETGDWIYTYK